ncbi:hypothetical protein BD310DRAFT_918608 [Dichomitus squalens]|uniref:Uncharacterized protein n=1 Tax=Dichomitus squalens TaxID=114155 RepID=A0A4Q9Q6E7_9APHY|nr:hypothetical protein BD310DRAFT_918608 [Dichomitus squalens]
MSSTSFMIASFGAPGSHSWSLSASPGNMRFFLSSSSSPGPSTAPFSFPVDFFLCFGWRVRMRRSTFSTNDSGKLAPTSRLVSCR